MDRTSEEIFYYARQRLITDEYSIEYAAIRDRYGINRRKLFNKYMGTEAFYAKLEALMVKHEAKLRKLDRWRYNKERLLQEKYPSLWQ
jgi:hypothetical protein